MFYTIYKVTNKINDKFYIGKHQTRDLNDSYMGSGIYIEKAIKKYGKENFKKEILHVFNTEEEMNAKEKEILTEDMINDRDCYNAGIGGEGGPHFKGRNHSPETIEKCRIAALSYRHSTERKAKIGAHFKGKILSEEHKQKVSKSMKQYHKTRRIQSLPPAKELL